MNCFNFLVETVFVLVSTHVVFGNSHMNSTNNLVTPNQRITHDNIFPNHKSLNEIYKRKHNVNSSLNLHPTISKSVNSENSKSTKAEDVNDFLVYYPEKYAKHHQKKQLQKADQRVRHGVDQKKESDQEQKQMPLILGSIGTGVYQESSDSLMSLKEAISDVLGRVSSYFREAYGRAARNLNSFFDAVDNYSKNNIGSTMFDINEYPF